MRQSPMCSYIQFFFLNLPCRYPYLSYIFSSTLRCSQLFEPREVCFPVSWMWWRNYNITFCPQKTAGSGFKSILLQNVITYIKSIRMFYIYNVLMIHTTKKKNIPLFTLWPPKSLLKKKVPDPPMDFHRDISPATVSPHRPLLTPHWGGKKTWPVGSWKGLVEDPCIQPMAWKLHQSASMFISCRISTKIRSMLG